MRKKQIHSIALLIFFFIPTVVLSEEITRPTLLSDKLYANQFYSEKPNDSLLWTKTLLDLKIPDFSPHKSSSYFWETCNYKNALLTLLEIQSQEGQESPYVKLWAANQDKVLSACENKTITALIPPTQMALPLRAQSDFLYQLGSLDFYQRHYEAALQRFHEVEKFMDAPQRPTAAYMVVRTLAYLNRAEDAYQKIEEILSDSSLSKVHGIAKNYRFVIMSNSRSFSLSLTGNLAKEHLLWLQNVIRLKSEDIKQTDAAFLIQKDALEQFNLYFPLFDPNSKAVDWWLNGATPEGSRMQAVKNLAPQNPLIDWMQAKWAYNVFNADWLWALHQPNNAYWEQNKNIVRHAFEKWKGTNDGVWLQIAMMRVHPKDALADEILADAIPYLNRPWEAETPEYRFWLFDLWTHAIRIYLGKGEIKGVDSMISNHWDYYTKGLLSFPESHSYSYYSTSFMSVLTETLRWLVYTGEFDNARSLLKKIQARMKNEFLQWESLLATNQEEALSVALTNNGYSSHYGNDVRIWEEMLNILPTKTLYVIATDERVNQKYRAYIARTIFTRAILLEYDNDLMDKYAALAGKLNPEIREPLLASVAEHDRNKYIGFLLTMPRFRPTVFWEDYGYSYGDSAKLALDAIDVYNHSDNNWWCRFDDEMLDKRIFDTMKILPRDNILFSFGTDQRFGNKPIDQQELKPYLEFQKKLLSSHPYMRLVDKKEITALKSIPSGPQYLSEAVIRREKSWLWFFANSKEKNERAANLHRAVRTTRYGCERNGNHGTYSREAFKLLHHHYKDTPWAKATPYWFE